jgi:hypothetical protein
METEIIVGFTSLAVLVSHNYMSYVRKLAALLAEACLNVKSAAQLDLGKEPLLFLNFE